MASISESGFAKLVANLRVLIAAAIKFAEKYNPFKNSLKIPELESLAARGDAAILRVSTAIAEYKRTLDERDNLFETLSSLVTRVMNALKASESTERIDEAAMSIVRKIQGSRLKRRKASEENIAEGAEETTKEVSVSQMSFDNRIKNLQDLIQLLAGIPVYKPNETELQVDSLNKFREELITKNNAVVSAYLALKTARTERNDVMFKPKTGIVDVALDAKSYIKSLFGAKSDQYRQISSLKFNK